MILLDTDIIIWVLRGKPEVVNLISRVKEKEDVVISTMTVAEVYMNAFPGEFALTDRLLNQHVLIPVDADIAKQGGLYWQQFAKKFRRLSIADCLIAATARISRIPLLTYNTRHFPMTDIVVKKPEESRIRGRNHEP